jgi:hypothetical protein
MPEGNHKTVPIQVWADIDEGIAETVKYLNTIPGVRTLASCQGTIGEGGPNPYRAQVMVTWDTEETFDRLSAEFDTSEVGNHWCYVHPRQEQTMRDADGNELKVGDEVQTVPNPDAGWRGTVTGEGVMGRVEVDIAGAVTSFAPPSIRKISRDTPPSQNYAIDDTALVAARCVMEAIRLTEGFGHTWEERQTRIQCIIIDAIKHAQVRIDVRERDHDIP